MQNQIEIDINKVVVVSVVVVALIASICAANYFLVVKPKYEKEKIEELKKTEKEKLAKEAERREQYIKCVNDANKFYKLTWSKWCRDFGIDSMSADCTLADIHSSMIKEVLRLDLDTCERLYGKKN